MHLATRKSYNGMPPPCHVAHAGRSAEPIKVMCCSLAAHGASTWQGDELRRWRSACLQKDVLGNNLEPKSVTEAMLSDARGTGVQSPLN